VRGCAAWQLWRHAGERPPPRVGQLSCARASTKTAKRLTVASSAAAVRTNSVQGIAASDQIRRLGVTQSG